MAKRRRKRRPQHNSTPGELVKLLLPQFRIEPRFMLVRKGLVQRVANDIRGDGNREKCWPVAGTMEDAQRLVDFYKAAPQGVRAAEIGTAEKVHGDGTASAETLQGHILLAIAEECAYMTICVGWEGDRPLWDLFDLRNVQAVVTE